MIPTIEYVKRKFDEYNQLMFEGKLQPLPFKLSSARTFLGKVSCYRTAKLGGGYRYHDFQFVISNKCDRDERLVEDTIIHEMINYWIFSNQMQDTSSHGRIFKAKMQEINRRFGRNLSVTHKNTEEELDKDREIRQHLVCVSSLRDHRLAVTVASKSKLFMLWDRLPQVPQVAKCEWYLSTDPFFNRYPRACSLRIYPISREELEPHMKDFRPLVRTGDTIRVAKK